MGKRSTNTTKSGKFMNPTDQARKIARKKELKKNKKQRLLVRTTVIKGKDPITIIADLDRLDEIEYNVYTPPTLSEKVLKDKRRKLMETWGRMCSVFAKEDRDRLKDLKKLEAEYESKRSKMQKFYESVKLAQEVSIDEIPLPTVPPGQSDPTLLNEMSFDPSALRPTATTSILSRRTLLGNTIPVERSPPGVPPGLPPEWSEPEEDLDSDEDNNKGSKKAVNFSELPSEKQAFVNEFLKEVGIDDMMNPDSESKSYQLPTIAAAAAVAVPMCRPNLIPPPTTFPHHLHGSLPPGMIMSPRGPILAPPMGSMRPQMAPSGGICIPPPSGMLGQAPNSSVRPAANPNIPKPKRGITIESKPQLRNLSADLTKFVPTSLRVRRNEASNERKVIKPGMKRNNFGLTASSASSSALRSQPSSSHQQMNSSIQSGQSRDDAYEQFMREMEGIM